MQNPNQFQNMEFKRLVEVIRNTMPLLAVGLLVGVYVISAIAAGKFLASPTLLGKLPNGIVLAYAVGGAIQATRATLVFFNQLNPVRPVFNYAGESIAVGMGLLSIYEICALTTASGMGGAVAVSLSILMGSGILIELFLLRELKFNAEMELFATPGYFAQIEAYHQARADLKARLSAIRSGVPTNTHRQEPGAKAPTLPTTRETEPGTTTGATADTMSKTTLQEVAMIAPFSSNNGNGKHH